MRKGRRWEFRDGFFVTRGDKSRWRSPEDKIHIRLFCLASEMLARVHEQRKSCLPDVPDRLLVEEFDNIDAQIGVMAQLLNLAAYEWIDDQARSKHVILQLTKDDLKLHPFDLELEASVALLEFEKNFPEDDIVLIGADSVAEMTSAFRNYFGDVREFMQLINQSKQGLLS